MTRSLLAWLGFAACLAPSPALAQISFPAGEVFGYAISTEVDSTLPSFVNQQNALEILAVPFAEDSLSLSDSLTAPIASRLDQANIFTGCFSTWTADMDEPLSGAGQGTQSFSLQADAKQIDFSSVGQTRHRHTLSDACCQTAPLTVTTEEKPSTGAFFVPFEVPATVSMTIEEISRTAAWTYTLETGNGSFGTTQSGTLQIELFLIGAPWVSLGKVNHNQFSGPHTVSLPPARYGLLITYEQEESLTSTGACTSYFVESTATESMTVRLSFQ